MNTKKIALEESIFIFIFLLLMFRLHLLYMSPAKRQASFGGMRRGFQDWCHRLESIIFCSESFFIYGKGGGLLFLAFFPPVSLTTRGEAHLADQIAEKKKTKNGETNAGAP